MTPIYYQPSLKAKFNFVISIIFLVMVLASLTVFTLATRGILSEFAERIARKQAMLVRNKMDSVIDRELALATTLASDPLIREWVGKENDPLLKREAMAQLENYRSHARDKSAFVAVAKSRHYYLGVAGEQGGELKTKLLEEGLPSTQWFDDAMRNVKTYALNLDYEPVIEAAKVWFNVAIYDTAGNKIGLGGGGIDISEFIKDVVLSHEPGVQAIIIDRDGVIQAHPDLNLVQHNAHNADSHKKITIYSLMQDPAERESLRNALGQVEGDEGRVEAFPMHTSDGRAIAAISAMHGTGWYTLVTVDVAEVVSSRVFWPMLALILASLVAVMLTITYFIGRMVIRPLTVLTGASRQIADGEYGVSLPVDRVDEIGQLTASFNSMATKVLDYTQNLEGMVKERTAELTAANDELNQARQRSLESLRYARTIQRSILPKAGVLGKAFKEHLVIYHPKDIVGGDLYYFHESGGRVLIGLMDCTGHGVPGAFMTMTVHSVLNHVIGTIENADPAVILRETDRVLRETLSLHETGEGSVDCGLEMALCVCDRSNGRLSFAGAGLPLYRLRDGALECVKGDRQRLGYRGDFSAREFTRHDLDIRPGDRFYATTDGFLDEGGGPKGYGFGTRRFEAMLVAHAAESLASQAQAFEDTLRLYRGDNPRRDDIAVIGFSL